MRHVLVRDDSTRGISLVYQLNQLSPINLFLQVSSGTQPFDRIQQHTTLVMRVVNGKRPNRERHNGTPEQLWSLIASCWVKEAANRPEMADVVRRLGRIVL